MAVKKRKKEEEVVKESPKKKSNVSSVIEQLNNKFGKNTIMIGFPEEQKLKRVPTGSFTLDLAVGGGIPVGRFTELSGQYSVSKTTQSLLIVANAQRLGYVCALIDVEGTTDEDFAKKVGVDFSNLIYSRPDGMEEALEILITLQKSGEVNFAVLDSIASMSPTKETESTMSETVQMGIPQKLLGEYFRKYTSLNNRLVRENKTPFTLIGINQIREKIGSYGYDNTYTPGGRAKGFTSSLDIRLKQGEWITEGKGENKNIVGQVVKFSIEKNKTHKRKESGEFNFYFADNNANVPIFHNDTLQEVLILATEFNIIERGGAWFTYVTNEGEVLKYQGLENILSAIKENENILEEIKEKVRVIFESVI